jgi:hypothetical protein
MHPVKGPSRGERNELTRYAKQGFTALIVDDPPHTGGTIVLAVEIARRVGFDLTRIKVLVPNSPGAPNWADTLPDRLVITLEPEQWRKHQLLDPKSVEKRLAEYFARQGASDIRVVGNRRVDELNAALQNSIKRGAALKQIFEVQLRTAEGTNESRYVLAKSLGLGYLGYPAFLAAHRLSEFVPPLLGLRDGMLYTEWLLQQHGARDARLDRASLTETTAAYITSVVSAETPRSRQSRAGKRPGAARGIV